MAAIAIVASGTRGDVQPYVALGVGLRRAGHDVRVLTSDSFEQLVSEAGLEFGSSGPSIEVTLQSEEWRRVIDRGNFLRILAMMRSEVRRAAGEIAARMPGLLAGSDLLVTGMAGLGGVFSIADRLGIPVLQAYAVPFTPTGAFPSPLVPRLRAGRALNRLSFHLTHQLFWQSSKPVEVATRRALGLGRAPLWGPFGRMLGPGAPVLYGYSPLVLPRPSDWPASHVLTGYWFLDAPDEWQPPDDLLAFLEAGPPVYIGFGSMINRDPAQAGRIALEALDRAGQRGVLASGWGGLHAADLPEGVHMVSALPHSWLFARMAAVVHHGGAGTTAAGLRAGVPAIIVPFMGDQAFWGRRVAQLGVGPPPIARRQLSAERLARAIDVALSDATRRRAAALGRALRDEDGVGDAVRAIDGFLERRSARAPLALY